MSLATLPELPSLASYFTQAATRTVDDLGNIFDAAGGHIGAIPGSAADIGKGGTTGHASGSSTSQASSNIPTTNTSPTRASDYIKKITDPFTAGDAVDKVFSWVYGLVQTQRAEGSIAHAGVTLEDIVFILLGLLLIAAALFSFKPAQEFAKEFGKSAIKAAAIP